MGGGKHPNKTFGMTRIFHALPMVGWEPWQEACCWNCSVIWTPWPWEKTGGSTEVSCGVGGRTNGRTKAWNVFFFLKHLYIQKSGENQHEIWHFFLWKLTKAIFSIFLWMIQVNFAESAYALLRRISNPAKLRFIHWRWSPERGEPPSMARHGTMKWFVLCCSNLW